MKRLSLLAAFAMTGLVATASAVDFTGVCETGRYTVAIDSVEFLGMLGWMKLMTPDWGGDTMVTDSFEFTALPSWPEAARLYMLIDGGETQFRIDTLVDGEWYALPLPPPEPRVKFCLPDGIAAPGTPAPSTCRLQPSGTVACGPVWFNLDASGPARFEVFDACGRPVASLTVAAGTTRLSWNPVAADGRLLPAGTYFCRLRDQSGTAAARIVFAR
ncbi:MAG: hypothetical protein ABIK37_05565 [candidate division WOR-3 bacterium]